MKKLVIELPIRIKKNKNKNNQHYAINLNQYRNWHFMVETNIKKKYKELVTSKIPEDTKLGKVEVYAQLHLKLHNKDGSLSKVRKDKGNVYSIVSKYVFDCLVENGILEEDNDFIIKREIIEETIPVKTQEEEKIVFTFKEIK